MSWSSVSAGPSQCPAAWTARRASGAPASADALGRSLRPLPWAGWRSALPWSSTARPSVVLRMPSPGEELWDIAKAHGTTMEQILQANELEEEALPAGRMLLIPSAR